MVILKDRTYDKNQTLKVKNLALRAEMDLSRPSLVPYLLQSLRLAPGTGEADHKEGSSAFIKKSGKRAEPPESAQMDVLFLNANMNYKKQQLITAEANQIVGFRIASCVNPRSTKVGVSIQCLPV